MDSAYKDLNRKMQTLSRRYAKSKIQQIRNSDKIPKNSDCSI